MAKMQTQDQGFSDYSVLSKSFNNPQAIRDMKRHFATIVSEREEIELTSDRQDDKNLPLKSNDLTQAMSSKDKIEKLHKRQALKPLERHLKKPVD